MGPRRYTSRHTSPEDGDARDSRKETASSSVEGSLPSSLTKRYFDCQKTKGAGFKPPREAARSLQFSRFFFEIWERESAPADYCLMRRLSMVAVPSSLPPNVLADDEPEPTSKHTPGMAAYCCRFGVWFVDVHLVNIEVFSSSRVIQRSRERSCISQDH